MATSFFPETPDLLEFTIEEKDIAARMIQRCYRRFFMCRAFGLLSKVLLQAEGAFPREFLRLFEAKEAALLSDKALKTVMRLRLDGSVYPPVVVFKVFVQTQVVYMTGRTIIGQDAKANSDAMAGVGLAQSMRMTLEDEQVPGIESGTDGDITRLMRTISQADAAEARLGGKSNDWRPLFRVDFVSVYKNAENLMGLSHDGDHLATLFDAAGGSRDEAENQLKRLIDLRTRRALVRRKRIETMRNMYVQGFADENSAREGGLVRSPSKRAVGGYMYGNRSPGNSPSPNRMEMADRSASAQPSRDRDLVAWTKDLSFEAFNETYDDFEFDNQDLWQTP